MNLIKSFLRFDTVEFKDGREPLRNGAGCIFNGFLITEDIEAPNKGDWYNLDTVSTITGVEVDRGNSKAMRLN